MPALVYLVGCPTHVAVGTDLFEVAISGLYGAASFTFKGRTELVAALIMLVGAAIGAQVGAVATKYIKGYGIRIAFGCAVLGCLASVVLKLIQPYFPAYAGFINGIATVVVRDDRDHYRTINVSEEWITHDESLQGGSNY